MSGKLTNKQKTKMLLDYVKSGITPEGYYVITDKNERIQFRRIKKPLDQEAVRQKIIKLEDKINALKLQLKDIGPNN